jgi:hypothetical protein
MHASTRSMLTHTDRKLVVAKISLVFERSNAKGNLWPTPASRAGAWRPFQMDYSVHLFRSRALIHPRLILYGGCDRRSS